MTAALVTRAAIAIILDASESFMESQLRGPKNTKKGGVSRSGNLCEGISVDVKSD